MSLKSFTVFRRTTGPIQVKAKQVRFNNPQAIIFRGDEGTEQVMPKDDVDLVLENIEGEEQKVRYRARNVVPSVALNPLATIENDKKGPQK